MADPSLLRFRAVVAAALAHLEANRQRVNDLNVFPVADGDTGDNMVLTLHAVVEELDRLATQGDLDEIGRTEIVDSVARAALLGARGNSGVILSQLIRGAAEELISRPGELVDPVLIGAAMARAADRAYASVTNPAEGTILTVVREMAHRIAHELPRMNEPRLDEHSADRQDDVIAAILEPALDAGNASVANGPQLLPVLREAGVVDAGGYGLTILFAGVIAALRGEGPPEVVSDVGTVRVTQPQHESSTFRYCTNFAVTGKGLDAASWRLELEGLGDSILVVGDPNTLRVHLHTDDPEQVTALFENAGKVSRLDVADMHSQIRERVARLEAQGQRCGALAVVNGDGMADLFRGLGVTPLATGRTLNPSTYELLAGIHGVDAEEVVVLPNSRNVFMAAQRAAELSEKNVEVVESGCQQAGLAAVIELDFARSASENALLMNAALGRVRCGSVTVAARDDHDKRFVIGDSVGFVGDELFAWGDPEITLTKVLAELGREAELLTLIAGADAPIGEDVVIGLAPTGLELEYAHGGQASYWWLISAE